MNRSDEWADRLDPAADDPDLPPEDRGALDRLAAALADAAVWSDPPPALRDSVLARAAAEGRTPTPESGIVPMPAPRFPDGGRRSRSSRARSGSGPRRGAARAWWWSIGGLAAAAALVVVLAWPRPQPPLTLALSGTGLAPAATATAELKPTPAGLAIALHIRGLGPAPPGHYYAAWLSGPDGVVPVGTFHWRKGGVPINLWGGVLPDRYPVLFVTLQKEGSPPSPSAAVVLRGRAPARPTSGTGGDAHQITDRRTDRPFGGAVTNVAFDYIRDHEHDGTPATAGVAPGANRRTRASEGRGRDEAFSSRRAIENR